MYSLPVSGNVQIIIFEWQKKNINLMLGGYAHMQVKHNVRGNKWIWVEGQL